MLEAELEKTCSSLNCYFEERRDEKKWRLWVVRLEERDGLLFEYISLRSELFFECREVASALYVE